MCKDVPSQLQMNENETTTHKRKIDDRFYNVENVGSIKRETCKQAHKVNVLSQ